MNNWQCSKNSNTFTWLGTGGETMAAVLLQIDLNFEKAHSPRYIINVTGPLPFLTSLAPFNVSAPISDLSHSPSLTLNRQYPWQAPTPRTTLILRIFTVEKREQDPPSQVQA